jgi:hypothetical protein
MPTKRGSEIADCCGVSSQHLVEDTTVRAMKVVNTFIRQWEDVACPEAAMLINEAAFIN